MADLYEKYSVTPKAAKPKEEEDKADLYARYGIVPPAAAAPAPQPGAPEIPEAPPVPEQPQPAPAPQGRTFMQHLKNLPQDLLAAGGELAAGTHRGLAGAAQLSQELTQPVLSALGGRGFKPVSPEQRQAGAQAPAQAQEQILASTEARERLSPGQRKALGLTGEILPTLALPIKGVTSAGVAGGAIGASQFSPTGETTPTQRLGHGLFGAAGGSTVAVLSGPIAKALTDTARGVRELVKEFDPAFRVGRGTTKVQQEEAARLSEELGDFITPGEATQSPVLRATEGRLRLDEGAQHQAFARLRRRDSVVQEHVQEVSKRLLPEGRQAAVAQEDALYKGANQVETGAHWLQMLQKQHPVIRKVVKQRGLAEEGDPFVQGTLQQIAEAEGSQLVPGTVGELDFLRKALNKANEVAVKRGDKASSRVLTQAAADTRRVIDAFAPDHAVARALSQRRILADKINRTLEEGKAGSEVGNTFFEKYLADGKKRRALQKDIESIADDEIRPAVQDKVDLLNRVLPKIYKSPLAQSLKGVDGAGAIGAKGGGTRARQLAFVGGLLEGAQDRALVDFITSSAWTRADLAKAVTAKEPNRMAEQLFNFLQGVGSRAAAAESSQRIENIPGVGPMFYPEQREQTNGI